MNAAFVLSGHSSPVSASSSSRLTSSSTCTLIQHRSSHSNVCRVHSPSSMPRLASHFSASKSSFSYSPHRRVKLSPSPSAAFNESNNTICCSATGAQASTSEGFLLSVLRQIVSLALVCFIQTLVSKSLASLGWVFPAPLATMLLVLGVITMFRLLGQSNLIDHIINIFFSPALGFLSKWLAVFFVPNLVMLPLAPAMPSADLTKIVMFVPVAFGVTLVFACVFCCFLRGLSSKTISTPNTISAAETITSSSSSTSTPNGSKPKVEPTNRLIISLLSVCVATLGICVRAGSISNSFARVYALCATLLMFSIGQRMNKQVKLVLHPLVSCTLGTLGMLQILSLSTGTPFVATLTSYYLRAKTNPLLLGAGDMLSALLGPAVVTFAFTIDKHRKLALSRLVEVVCVSFVVACLSLLGTAFCARIIQLAASSRLLLIPRTVTAPLAIPIANLLGADAGLAASVVAVTGLIGANIGRILLNVLKVQDPVVRGLALGSSAHGLGTAAMNEEPKSLPFAALAMALVGIFSTILVAIPAFRTLLLKLALSLYVPTL